MRVKTNFAAAAFILMLTVLPLTGCVGKSDTVIDVDRTAEALLGEIEFDDEPTLLDSEAVKYLYGIADTVDAVVYMGSGATSEELAVFDAGTDEGGEAMLETVREHVEEQIESYRNYIPAEVARLENAVIAQEGRYVILCVTNDKSAAEKINAALGK